MNYEEIAYEVVCWLMVTQVCEDLPYLFDLWKELYFQPGEGRDIAYSWYNDRENLCMDSVRT